MNSRQHHNINIAQLDSMLPLSSLEAKSVKTFPTFGAVTSHSSDHGQPQSVTPDGGREERNSTPRVGIMVIQSLGVSLGSVRIIGILNRSALDADPSVKAYFNPNCVLFEAIPFV